jgi:hypothetical protein
MRRNVSITPRASLGRGTGARTCVAKFPSTCANARARRDDDMEAARAHPTAPLFDASARSHEVRLVHRDTARQSRRARDARTQ